MRLEDSNYRIFFIVSNALSLLILSISSKFVSSSVYGRRHLMHLHKILFKTTTKTAYNSKFKNNFINVFNLFNN